MSVYVPIPDGAPSFVDWMRAKYGTGWCVAPRLTAYLKDRGYTAAIPQTEFMALTREWETLAYGAPLAEMLEAAPDMLKALRDMVADFGDDFAGPTLDAARAAIAKATGCQQ